MNRYFVFNGKMFVPEPTAVAIDADKIPETLGKPYGTYANILLRPQALDGSKDSPIPLLVDEWTRIKAINGNDPRKAAWIAGSDHTRFIYLEGEDGSIKVTSISGYYSNSMLGSVNHFKVLKEVGDWLLVETLKAGSDWWKGDIPSHCLHRVWSLNWGNKIIDNPPGIVWLPVITRTGDGWIKRVQCV